MAIAIISEMSRSSVRATVLLAAVLLPIALLACRNQSNSKDDDEDERPPAGVASVSAAPVNVPLAQSAITWNFDAATTGSPPTGFSFGRTGSGRPGRWVVRAVPDAPSRPSVLAQEDNDGTDYRFPIAVEDSVSFKDLSLSVHCKPVEGRVDRACGIVWRYHDENNYYLARANALENNVTFYYVDNGRRSEVKGWNGRVSAGVWHELRADMHGDHVEIYFDGAKVIDAHDSRFLTPGRVGVWTKADSYTLFDDLTAAPLGS